MAVISEEGLSGIVSGTSGSDLIFATTLGIGNAIINTGTGGDTAFENDEIFTVRLSNPTVGGLDKGTAIATIVNDDEQGDSFSVKQIDDFDVVGTELTDFYEATQSGIQNSTFDTKGEADTIRSTLRDISANTSIFASIFNTQINTGGGNDSIEVTAETGSYGIQFSQIDTGDDQDTITITNSSGTGNGINATTINAGSGDDKILIDVTVFALSLNENSVLNGEEGNDTFELRSESDDSGFGTINGGSGDEDLLILEGESDDYNYELGSSTDLTGTISGKSVTTLLSLEGVQLFQFVEEPGITYTYQEFFVDPNAPASVGDFVWEDLDGNGLQDPGEPGIEGVEVRLWDVTNRQLINTVFTDANGFYSFEDIDQQPLYDLLFFAPDGFEPTILNVDNFESFEIDSDASPISSSVQIATVGLSPGENNTTIDAGYVRISNNDPVEVSISDLSQNDGTPELGENISEPQISGVILGSKDADNFEATESGISNAALSTLKGDDTIIGRLKDVPASEGITAAIDNSQIRTGAGDDTITAEAETGLFAINDTAIFAGRGKDTITGLATGAGSIGISGGRIAAQGGDDLIIAEGTDFALEDALIRGGAGSDTIDLQGSEEGTGRLSGGRGIDLLILNGLEEEYQFTGSGGRGTIVRFDGTGIATGTNLAVDGIENFEFSDGSTLGFEELFV